MTRKLKAAEKFLEQLKTLDTEMVRKLTATDKLGPIIDRIDNECNDEGEDKGNKLAARLGPKRFAPAAL